MRLVAFSPPLAGPAAELLGEPAIRIYHDNACTASKLVAWCLTWVYKITYAAW
jgi:hypothetical protein